VLKRFSPARRDKSVIVHTLLMRLLRRLDAMDQRLGHLVRQTLC
jgi:hypothetical protein